MPELGAEVERKQKTHPAPTHPQAAPAPHTSMLVLKARFTLALIFTTCPTLGEKSRR